MSLLHWRIHMSGRATVFSLALTLATAVCAPYRCVGEESATARSQPAVSGQDQSDPRNKPPLASPKMKAGERAGMRMRANRLGRDALDGMPKLGTDDSAGSADPFLTDEQIDRLMTFMQANFPVMHDRLARTRQRDPELFQKRIHQTARVLFPMVRAAAENPELGRKLVAEHQAQLALQDLKEKYSKAKDPSDQARIREQMRQQMDVAFEARIERLRLEVKQLQKRLDQATLNLARQEKDKEKFISSRLSDMLSSNSAAP